MEDAVVGRRYWCHLCSQIVSPVMDVDLKCPYCRSGFVEEMSADSNTNTQGGESVVESDHQALSLWAPILLGMMDNNPHRSRRLRRYDFEDNNDTIGRIRGETSELDRELESIIRRRRRSSANILQLLQGIRTGISSEVENGTERNGDEGETGRERERVVLINPFNQTIVLQGSYDGQGQNNGSLGSLGDYVIGPNIDLLLQHLAENDPNRYGTPPAKKEAVGAMPTVKVKDNLQCSICLEEFGFGADAKEMPCNHKFHDACIFPWLELHSSCPVCRYQLPADESKLNPDGSRANINIIHEEDADEGRTNSGSGRRFSIPWPFTGLFSSQTSGRTATSSSSSTSSSSANNPDRDGGNSHHSNEN